MKVGDYVRLNNTLYDTTVILKIMEVYDNTILTENDGSIFQGEYGKDEIINHSYNIIDLIEVGDIIHYHNEYIDFISPVIIYDDGEIASNLYDSDGYIFLDKEKDKNNIKSIVTKEQFEAMEYKCE